MPRPAFPDDATRQAAGADIDGRRHDHWVVDVAGAERTHVFVDAATQLPRRLVPRARVRGRLAPRGADARARRRTRRSSTATTCRS